MAERPIDPVLPTVFFRGKDGKRVPLPKAVTGGVDGLLEPVVEPQNGKDGYGLPGEA